MNMPSSLNQLLLSLMHKYARSRPSLLDVSGTDLFLFRHASHWLHFNYITHVICRLTQLLLMPLLLKATTNKKLRRL